MSALISTISHPASRMMSIGEAATMIGVSTRTLRRWDRDGKLEPAFRTHGNHRRYDRRKILVLIGQWSEDELVGGGDVGTGGDDVVKRVGGIVNAATYARVSSSRQKQSGDLQRQVDALAACCRERGYRVSGTFLDVGSGINDRRRGLLKLLKDVALGHHDVVMVNYRDRLSRFGVNVIREFLSSWGVELIVVNKAIDAEDPNAELIEDFMSILYSFMGKIYRRRRGKRGDKQGGEPGSNQVA